MLVTFLDSSEHILNRECPPNLCASQCDHTKLLLDPLHSLFLSIVEDCPLNNCMKCFLHLLVDSIHPVLDCTLRLLRGLKVILLTLVGNHTENLLVALTENNIFAIIEQFK